MEPAQALQVTQYLSEAYPRDEWSQERFVLWADAIGDLDHHATIEAAKRWVKGEKWPPTVAEIRELSEVVRDEQRRQAIRMLPPADPEPEITPEQRAANLERLRAMVQKLADAKSMSA